MSYLTGGGGHSIDAVLRSAVGSVVRIEFDDGESIDAKVVSVDVEEHDDVVYEPVKIPEGRSKHTIGQYYRSAIADIQRVTRPE